MTLYAVVRDNVETLYAAVAAGFEAELFRRTFAVDVESCPRCGGRMRLLAVITDLANDGCCITAESLPSHPLELRPATRRTFKTLVVRRQQPTMTSPQRELFEEH